MDNERLRWITGKPTLDWWALTVRFSDSPQGVLATVSAQGHSNRRRGTLWTHDEIVPAAHGRYAAGDLIHHLALVAAQDRPASNTALTRALLGAAWDQPELPF